MAEGNSKSGNQHVNGSGEPVYRAPSNFLIVQSLKARPGFPAAYIDAERLPKEHLDRHHERLDSHLYAEIVATLGGTVLYHAYEIHEETGKVLTVYPNRHCSAAAFYSRWVILVPEETSAVAIIDAEAA